MRILFVTPHLPELKTPQAGERMVFEVLKALSERHEVYLVVRLHEGQAERLDQIKPYCTAVYSVSYTRPARRDLFNLTKVVLSYYRLCRRANDLAEKQSFDRIHVEWTETGLFMRKRGLMVVDAHDVLTKPMERRYRKARGLRRLLFSFAYAMTRVMEPVIYRKFDVVFTRSEYDKEYLAAMAPELCIKVLPHPAGLDISDRKSERDDRTLLFLAAMDRGPNVEAVLHFWSEILPLIRERVHGVRFLIVGSRPLPEVLALGEIDKNTIVTGYVENVEPYLKKATIFVAPLLTGGGIIVKILDALAAGIPVVTTSIGNEGIRAIPGKQLLIGDTPAEFADQVVGLLQNSTLRGSLSEAGQAYVRDRFNLERMRETLKEIYPGDSNRVLKNLAQQ